MSCLACIFSFFFQASLEVIVSPDSASIKLDDKQVENVFSARPGEYKLTISKDGYLTYKKDIKIDYFANQPIKVELQEEPTFSLLDQEKRIGQRPNWLFKL